MITASIDRQKLQRSLRRFAKDFGDTNAQALCRWGVQTCRELAKSTQAFGQTKTKGKQEGAILGDSLNVLIVVEKLTSTRRGYNAENQGKKSWVSPEKAITSPDQVVEWIDKNRTRRNRRTAKLPISERMVCDVQTHKKAMAIMNRDAGIAKGGWIGAGQDIANAQRGTDRVNIGKNFLSYTQKHRRFGSAKKPIPGWSPKAEISNRARHTGTNYVLSKSHSTAAIDWGLKKTVSWYRAALRRQDQKQKP